MMKAMELFTTPRLILRQFVDDDAQHLFDLNSDPIVTRYTDMAGRSPDLSTIQSFEIRNYISTYQNQPGYGIFAAIEAKTKEFVGWFMFRPFANAPYFDPAYPYIRDVEIGYRLKFAAWGRGLASEGVAGLLRYGFETLNVEAVMAVVLKDNSASIKVLQKNQMVRIPFESDELEYFRLQRLKIGF